MEKKLLRTAFVFDPLFLKHTKTGHPENASRLDVVMQELENKGLLKSLYQIPSTAASVDELENIHSIDHISDVIKLSETEEGYLDPDTYTNTFTWEAAYTAAGSLSQLTLDVIDGKYDNGFGFVRPPGHHAVPERGMGFCIFNNIAIAAKSAMIKKNIMRIAIIDFDLHHGNGTQAAFEENPDVLFISSHSYPYYPGTGNIIETGTGKAAGSIINMPLSAHTGDDAVKKLYETILPPLLQRFGPEVMLVSAGYDGHWCDPLGNLNFTLELYDWLTKLLLDLANRHCKGKIVFTLEGGYHLQALSKGVANSIRVLSEQKGFDDPLGKPSYRDNPLPDGYIEALKKIHKL